jgi:transcriptional regulator with XRE-family HTH domain
MTGKQMRVIRKKLKMTMEELGEFIGISESGISRFEAGKCRISGPVERLLLLLDASGGELLRKNPWNQK